MSSKNSFEGLQFRVLETIEKGKNIPLTAKEIAYRLHQDEYKGELWDTVIYKVTQACHAMKDRGKLVLSDARDKDGKLTYQLPHRMAFPRPSNTPPANPVLTPDIAEKIVTREPEVAKPKRGPRMTKTVHEQIMELIDKAPYPITAAELVPQVDHIWGEADVKTRKMRLATTLTAMEKERKIFTQPSTRRVPGTKYEYYTKKTGKPAPLPSQAWQAPDPVKTIPVMTEIATKAVVSKPNKPGLFRPVAPAPTMDDSITIKVTQDYFRKVNGASKKFGVSLEDFCRQAIDFALDHSE